MKPWDLKKGKKDARYKKILALRKKGMTLEQVGKVIGVTRERVRQLEFLANSFGGGDRRR